MSAKRISRRAAEQMLRGRSAGHPVARLLGSASAPARAEELSGEAEVLAAFRAAFAEAPSVVRTEPREEASSARSLLPRSLSAKIAGAVLAVTAAGAVGGVAIAAGGGLPVQKKDAPPKKQPARTSAPPHTRKYAPPPSPATVPTPSIAELCRTYLTQGRKAEHLEPLIKAAGGRKKAIALCVALLGGGDPKRPVGQWPTEWPSNWPTKPPKSQKWPTDWPTKLPEEWVRPYEDQQKGRKAKGTADGRSHWPEGWPDLGF